MMRAHIPEHLGADSGATRAHIPVDLGTRFREPDRASGELGWACARRMPAGTVARWIATPCAKFERFFAFITSAS